MHSSGSIKQSSNSLRYPQKETNHCCDVSPPVSPFPTSPYLSPPFFLPSFFPLFPPPLNLSRKWMWEERWTERTQEIISKAEPQLGRGGGALTVSSAWNASRGAVAWVICAIPKLHIARCFLQSHSFLLHLLPMLREHWGCTQWTQLSCTGHFDLIICLIIPWTSFSLLHGESSPSLSKQNKTKQWWSQARYKQYFL